MAPNSRAFLLGQIIAYFKYTSTKLLNENKSIHQLWQRNYYDHIIRDEGELHHIRSYIADNPSRWDEDILNPR